MLASISHLCAEKRPGLSLSHVQKTFLEIKGFLISPTLIHTADYVQKIPILDNIDKKRTNIKETFNLEIELIASLIFYSGSFLVEWEFFFNSTN